MNRLSPAMHLSAAVGERRGHGRARAWWWASGVGAGRRALAAAAGELGGGRGPRARPAAPCFTSGERGPCSPPAPSSPRRSGGMERGGGSVHSPRPLRLVLPAAPSPPAAGLHPLLLQWRRASISSGEEAGRRRGLVLDSWAARGGTAPPVAERSVGQGMAAAIPQILRTIHVQRWCEFF